MLEDLDLEYFKLRKKYLIDRLKKYNCFYEDSLYCESCIKYKTRIENIN